MDEPMTPTQIRLLRGLVVLMTTLIIVGVVVLAVELARRGGDMAGRLVGQARPAPADGESYRLALPAGVRIEQVIGLDGGRLALRVRGGDQHAEVLVIDATSGRVLGRISPGTQMPGAQTAE